jgi:hypothetical protein
MLNVIMLNVIMLNVIMLNVIMLNVVMLNVVILNVRVSIQCKHLIIIFKILIFLSIVRTNKFINIFLLLLFGSIHFSLFLNVTARRPNSHHNGTQNNDS